MSASENPFEGINFPQYRRYKNGKSYFKIISEKKFEEKTFLGEKILKNTYDVKILPDRNFVYDLLLNYGEFADPISASEYDVIH